MLKQSPYTHIHVISLFLKNFKNMCSSFVGQSTISGRFPCIKARLIFWWSRSHMNKVFLFLSVMKVQFFSSHV